MATTKRDSTSADSFTAEERAAMKEHAKELQASRRRSKDPAVRAAEEEQAVVDKIAELDGDDRVLAEKVHALVKVSAPSLTGKLWYGMPAWAKDGQIVCFFQPAAKFKARYSTLGFNDAARLDDGTMWPTSYALTTLTKDDEARLAELLRRAAG